MTFTEIKQIIESELFAQNSFGPFRWLIMEINPNDALSVIQFTSELPDLGDSMIGSLYVPYLPVMITPIYNSQADITAVNTYANIYKKSIADILGDFEVVFHGNRPDGGDRYETVYHFKDHDIYILFDGRYSSFFGFEYEEMYEVVPEQVMVTKYFQK